MVQSEANTHTPYLPSLLSSWHHAIYSCPSWFSLLPTVYSSYFSSQPKFTLLQHPRPPPTILSLPYSTSHTPTSLQWKGQCVWDVIQLSMVPNISVMGTYWPIMSLLSCPLLVQRHLTSCWYHIKIVERDIVIKLVRDLFTFVKVNCGFWVRGKWHEPEEWVRFKNQNREKLNRTQIRTQHRYRDTKLTTATLFCIKILHQLQPHYWTCRI